MWIIGPILVVILIAFKYIFPIDKDGDSKYYSIDQLRSEFFKIDLLSLLIFFVSIGFWSFIFYFLLNAVSNSNDYTNKFKVVILADPDFWMFCSIIMGLSFSFLSIILFLKLSLKDRISRFWIYYNKKYKFNAFLLFKILFISLSLGGYVLIFFGLKTHVLVNDNGMIIKDFFSMNERVYQFDKIKSIMFIENVQTTDGNINYSPHYKVVFDDGFFWTSSSVVDEDSACIQYLKTMTGLRIDNIELEK